MAGGVPFPRPNRMSDDLNRLSCVGHHGHDRQYNCPSFTAKASQTQLWNALLLSLLAMDGVQRGARLGFPIFMPLQSAAKSYRPMAESSSQPTVTNLVPSKQKCLGATPQAFIKAESDVLRTLDTTYGSAAFIWHLTPIISVSLTKLTRAYCRCGNDNALTKRKARATPRGPFARQA